MTASDIDFIQNYFERYGVAYIFKNVLAYLLGMFYNQERDGVNNFMTARAGQCLLAVAALGFDFSSENRFVTWFEFENDLVDSDGGFFASQNVTQSDYESLLYYLNHVNEMKMDGYDILMPKTNLLEKICIGGYKTYRIWQNI